MKAKPKVKPIQIWAVLVSVVGSWFAPVPTLRPYVPEEKAKIKDPWEDYFANDPSNYIVTTGVVIGD